MNKNILGVVGGILLFPIALLLVGVFLMIFACVWALGMPIDIKQNDKKIGYVRWFKFYKREE